MKKLTASLAAILLAACTAIETDPADEFRSALPRAQAAHVGTPQDEGGAAGALSVGRQPLGETAMLQSEYAVMSYYLALSVNGGAGLLLNLVQYIASFPATCADGTCVWGPWAGDQGLNAYKLVASKEGDAYHYALQGKAWASPDSAFVGILVGTAYPVDRDHGSGTFTLDFDLAHEGLAHGPGYVRNDYGQLVVTYDNTQNPVFVEADFVGARNSDPDDAHFMNAAYRFEDAASGGQLLVMFENLDTTEVVSLRTRWSAGGAGRADAHYTGPDGAGGTVDYYQSECWAGHAQDFAEVYDSFPAFGEENACSPFSTVQYADGDISLPQG